MAQAKMNRAVRHMFRNRRQREGVRPPEPAFAPPQLRNEWDPERSLWETEVPAHPDDWTVDILPGFSYVANEEHEHRNNRYLPPAFETNALEELITSYKPSSELDPLPFSDFYANGNKIRPWAHNNVANAGYLAIPEIESVSDDEFRFDKNAFPMHTPQYVGYQNPIDIQPLIPEQEYQTYGSLTTLSEAYGSPDDAYLFA
jgi:hypothetical protein